ncbi:hypothetical protein [Sporosarcina koreensis]|uniref:Uncharacterized protein n=1 Tax=Sporosarcina koreensis TaxID=334735 RepID=A0ABW0TTP7_9BACL
MNFVAIEKGSAGLVKRIAVLLISLALLIGCSDNNINRNNELEEVIHSFIIMVSDDSDSEIHISGFIDLDWDKAFLITPYTSQEEIEKQVGVKLKDLSNISLRDDIYLLVFLNNDSVVQYAEINRLQTSFSLGDHEYLSPANDVIYIER